MSDSTEAVDVAIVGGGLAGLATAVALHRVRPDARIKVCPARFLGWWSTYELLVLYGKLLMHCPADVMPAKRNSALDKPMCVPTQGRSARTHLDLCLLVAGVRA